MQTIQPIMAGPEFRARRQRRAAAAWVAIALLSGLVVMLWLENRVPSPDASPSRLARYMASPAFAARPDAQKAPYLNAFQRASDRGELTAEQQRDVINNRRGKNPIQQYFSLAPVKEREAFLDDIIDRVVQHEKLRPRPDKKAANESRIDAGRLADSIPPEDRARMHQFLQDLHDRRVARGVPDDGKFLFKLSR